MTSQPLDGRRVVLGVSGGIAAYKAALVTRGLLGAGAHVDVVLTRGAREFIGAATFEGLTGNPVRSEVWEDIADETHVALARAADVVVIYPATAHTIAKAAHGLADDLLTTTLLAATCPVVMAPAMHTEMWTHPATVSNVATLTARGVHLVGPDDGPLMGGDIGAGRAAEPAEVVDAVIGLLHADAQRDLAGKTVLITAGGTREPLDPVRYLGNRSSGRMGFALAAAAADRGASVTLIAAPTHLATPANVERVDVTTALQMYDEVMARAPGTDVTIKAAAVADFRPTEAADRKIKKAAGTPSLELVANPDILLELGRSRRANATGPTVLVGFAAETDDVIDNARDKLIRKGCDLLVVNDVSADQVGFGHDTNQVHILSADETQVDVPLQSKRAVADAVFDVVIKRLVSVETSRGR